MRLAQKMGVSIAARVYDVNRKTAYRWLDNYKNDGISDSKGLKIISVSDRREIIRFAKEYGVSNISEFIKKYKIKFSFSSVYKILASSKIPVDFPMVLSYHCFPCNRRFETLYLFIGKPNSLHCTICGGKLKLKKRRKVYFLGSIDRYLLAHGTELKSLTREDVEFIRKFLRPPESYFPKYVDFSDEEGNMITHIVSETLVDRLNCLCGIPPLKYHGMIYSSLSGTLNLDRICSVCVDEANELLAKGIKLEPKFKFERKSKIAVIEDAMALSKITKNIAQACKIYNVSRSSYYVYRNKKRSLKNKVGRIDRAGNHIDWSMLYPEGI